uniref:Uncharacterized protein n=1 Tax=Anguilla anguilla TaxID=7936 RepID=A0A0E9UYL7_ANGAN
MNPAVLMDCNVKCYSKNTV